MKQIINAVIIIILALVIGLTAIFTYMQVKKSQTVDEHLVLSLTTKLETALIQQVITNITAPVK